MEPKQDLFYPFLKPLLDAPDSRYVLRDWPNVDQWRPQRYVKEGLIPPANDEQDHKDKRSPILIIANLTDHALRIKKEYFDGPSMGVTLRAHSKAIDLAHAVRMKSLFHAYGPTRVLMWIPDTEKRSILPRTVSHRNKIATYLESTFHVEEIAGAIPSDPIQREDRLKSESDSIVAKRMEENGISIPPERQQKAANHNTTSAAAAVSTRSRSWHPELQELEEGFKNQRFTQFVGQPPGPIRRRSPGTLAKYPYTPEYARLLILRATFKHQNGRLTKLDAILKQQEEIDALDHAAHSDTITPTEHFNILKTLDSKIASYKQTLAPLLPKQQEALSFLDDDRRAFSYTPPLLLWDRRTADPLLVHSYEFQPQRELALLDFQPIPSSAQNYPFTHDQSVIYDTLCTHLFAKRGNRNLKELNYLAPGAYEALVPKSPAIMDPRKGGRRDVESVVVRTLTPEMLWQLTMAWDEWLFKPPMSEIVAKYSEFGFSAQQRVTRRYI